jgi:c(7)-type cytochrome triheme protein
VPGEYSFRADETEAAESVWSRVALAVAALVATLSAFAQVPDDRRWAPLNNDQVHDPTSPALKLLQQPGEALRPLPPDDAGTGNQVRWVKALEGGFINPRTNIFPETKVNVLDLDIMLNLNGGMPKVKFPHHQHTLWLDCSNCHEQLFKSKAGANKLSMYRILEGEQCGLCHGAVAFPLTECSRCHNTPWQQIKPPTAQAPASPAAPGAAQ